MRDMENKIYTEDDLHRLIGEAIQVIREGLQMPDIAARFSAAVQFLQMPVVSAVVRAQEEKMRWPDEIMNAEGSVKTEKTKPSV